MAEQEQLTQEDVMEIIKFASNIYSQYPFGYYTPDMSEQVLQNLNNKYNSAEGIVFTYKNRRMKLTGSFACINAILGARFSI